MDMLVSVPVVACAVWLSIRLVDGHNYKNKAPAALAWGGLICLAALCLGPFMHSALSLPLLMVFAVPVLVGYCTALLQYYELGFLQLPWVIGLQLAICFGVGLAIRMTGFVLV